MLQLNKMKLSAIQSRGWFRPRQHTPILHDISLTLENGELVALVGGSGEGKSLLLQTILGLHPAGMQLQGEFRLDGSLIQARDKERLRGNTLGYIPQSVSSLNPLIRVGRQMSRVAALSGLSVQRDDLLAQLTRYNLPQDTLNRYPLTLSGGMAKRVLVGCSTLSQARFILADEVTAWLDEQHAEVMITHLRELCEQGRGVLWVTHDLHLAASYADRVAVLYQGTIREIIDSATLRQGGGSPWLQRLWRALPEHDFMQEYCRQPTGVNHAADA